MAALLSLLFIFTYAALITNLRVFFDDSGINYFEYFLGHFCIVGVKISFIDTNVSRFLIS